MATTTDGLFKLLTWMSPSYPVGAYAFSHGLENAVDEGLVADRASAQEWIRDVIAYGNGRADLTFLRAAWEAATDREELARLAEYCAAYESTMELRLESEAQGRAFADVSASAWSDPHIERSLAAIGDRLPYPVVVGTVARHHGVDRTASMTAYGHALVANLVSAAVRLVPLGQTDGQRITAALESDVLCAVDEALRLDPYHVTTATLRLDIASMNHETQYTRLFRS